MEGQFVFLYCMDLSFMDLHPFSIASCNEDNKLEIITKIERNWTKNLYRTAKKLTKVKIRIDGPYGGCKLNLDRMDLKSVLLVGGGIGVSPLISFVKMFLYHMARNRRIENVTLVWVGRDKYLIPEIKILDSLARRLMVKERFNFHLYLTKKHNLKNQGVLDGRPNLSDYFKVEKVKAIEKKLNSVGVLVCGPESLQNTTIDLCYKFSDRKVCFDYHFEEFNPLA